MGSGSSTAPKSSPPEFPDLPEVKVHEAPPSPKQESSSRRSHVGRSPSPSPRGSDGRTRCKFFAKDGHCKFGDRCRFSHETLSEGQEIARSASLSSGRRSSAHEKSKKSATPCRDFLKGSCRFGDSCRYSHTNPDSDINETMRSDGDEDMLVLTATDVAVAVSNAMSCEEAKEILREAQSIVETKAGPLKMAKDVLVPEVQDMDDADRNASGGIKWQFRGTRRQGNFYDFEEDKSKEIEEAYQAWVDGGKSKKHSDRRYETEVGHGHKITLDFHLNTQRGAKGAVRVLRRYELPTKAQEMSNGYFDSVLELVGDVCDKIETVDGRKAGMGLTEFENSELGELQDGCVQAMRAIIEGFIQLALLCNSGDLLEKLIAVLGPARSASLGVEACGRNMRLKAVCQALKVAFEQKSYGKPLEGGESGWTRVQVLCTMGRFFYERPLVWIRQNLVKYRNDSMQMSRRHAFMLAGMLLNESSDDPDFTAKCKEQIRPLLQEGLQIAMTGGGDLVAIGSILSNCRVFEGFIDIAPVEAWLTSRINSSIRSLQPLQWTSELLSEIRGFVGVKISLAGDTIDSLIEKCAKEISNGSSPPENVNQFAIFRKMCHDFDTGVFEALTPFYEDSSTKAAVTEWLVAYCEHMKVDLPDYCMTSDQAECFDNLTNALDNFSSARGDTSEIKSAVIAAKLVPTLKDNAELCEAFEKALAVLKNEARLPPGWDLEDLLGTEKLFKKEEVTEPGALSLFQNLLDSTHQKRWTRDRATRGDGAKIADRFVVSHVTEVQNQSSWENYDKRRQEIIKSCGARGRVSDEQWEKWSGQVLTKDLGEKITKACKLTPLDPNCNEFLLFHGAKPIVADLIAENHFDISFASKDGMFGAGLYFAEASSKSDEYCSPNDAGEFPLILVRCTLGKLNYVDAPKPYDKPGRRQLEHSCMSGTYNSVLGDRIKVSGTYRELIVYDHFQAYPHFILWYKRQ